MPRMTQPQVYAALHAAIADEHAVTISLSGLRPIAVQPLSLSQHDGKMCLTYWRWHSQCRQPEMHMVSLIVEVVDLGRSLDDIEEGRPPTSRGPGRPRLYDGPREWVRVQLPIDLIAEMDAATTNRTAFIEAAIRAALGRTEE